MVRIVDISNLLDRWFSCKDAEKFLSYMKTRIRLGNSIEDIVQDWNALYNKLNMQVYLGER